MGNVGIGFCLAPIDISERFSTYGRIAPGARRIRAQLRKNLLVGIENPTAADTMSADIAIIPYRNLLRVQGWIGLCHVVGVQLR